MRLTRLRHLWSTLTRRPQFESDLDTEVRFHMEAYMADLLRSGVSREEALRRARLEFGSVDSMKEECRAARGVQWADEIVQNVRYAWRTMRHSPGFAGAAILSLALGIGVNTAIFSLIEAVLLRSLPVGEPTQLYFVGHGRSQDPTKAVTTKPDQTLPTRPGQPGAVSLSSNYALYDVYRSQADVFSGITAVTASEYKMDAGGGMEIVRGQLASGNFHAVLQAPIALGRGFMTDSDRDYNPVAVISHNLWTRRFGNSPDILGRTVRIDNKPVTIIGVTARDFFGIRPGYPVDVTISMSMAPDFKQPVFFTSKEHWTSMEILGRLRSGVTAQQAEAVVDGLFQQFVEAPDARWVRQGSPEAFQAARLEPAAKGINGLRNRFSTPLRVLFAFVVLVLAVACANTSSLLLARATARRREIAIRLSIGVSRARLVRQLLTESLLLAIAGGAAGFLIAFWCTDLLVGLFTSGPQPILFQVSPNWHVLLFTLAVSLLCGLVFGLVPALRALKVDTNSELKGGHSEGGTRFTAGKVIVAAQVATCALLLTGAALLSRTFTQLQRIDVGFNRHNLLLADLDTHGTDVPQEHASAIFTQVFRKVSAIPGVASASLSSTTPIYGTQMRRINVAGYIAPPKVASAVFANVVSPQFFETFGISLLRGRLLTEADATGRPLVAVVSESMARKYFPNSDALGRYFRFGDPDTPVQIVGIVKDTLQMDLRKPPMETVYTPLAQGHEPLPRLVLALRTAGDAMSLVTPMRSEVRAASKSVAIRYVRTMPDQINAMLLNERLLARLSGFFAILAAVLACIGLYGVMAYTVARRTREMGLRLALGATIPRLRWLILRQALLVSAAGLIVGIPAAAYASGYLGELLFRIEARSPLTYFAVAALLFAASAVAAYLPARAASRISPTAALRVE